MITFLYNIFLGAIYFQYFCWLNLLYLDNLIRTFFMLNIIKRTSDLRKIIENMPVTEGLVYVEGRTQFSVFLGGH